MGKRIENEISSYIFLINCHNIFHVILDSVKPFLILVVISKNHFANHAYQASSVIFVNFICFLNIVYVTIVRLTLLKISHYPQSTLKNYAFYEHLFTLMYLERILNVNLSLFVLLCKLLRF